MKSGNLDFLEPSGPLQACNGTDLSFIVFTLFVLFRSALSLVFGIISVCMFSYEDAERSDNVIVVHDCYYPPRTLTHTVYPLDRTHLPDNLACGFNVTTSLLPYFAWVRFGPSSFP